MALLIDTPRWPWRGHLWAHLISDTGFDELHQAARDLNLRWLLFGRDHYDVPDHRWDEACELATVVDQREIVRSLKRTGLRVPGGKSQKSWRAVVAPHPRLVTAEVSAWRQAASAEYPEADVEVLTRPDATVVLHLGFGPRRVGGDHLLAAPPGTRVIETSADGRWSLELVLAHQQ